MMWEKSYEEYKKQILNDIEVNETNLRDVEALLSFYLGHLIVGTLVDW